MINYTLKRSRRKTLTLYVRDGVVEVRAPMKTPVSAIDSFVASKQKWIADKLAKLKEQSVQRDSFSLDYGSLIAYRGERYAIEAREGDGAGFDGVCFFVPTGLYPDQIKAACIQTYRQLAKHVLTEKTFLFGQQMSVTPAAVKISNARTRWGSCSARKSINLSWHLVMADDDVIDYVVVHELAHITELNHSGRFWAIVAGVLPDYRERRARLRELQRRLSGENW